MSPSTLNDLPGWVVHTHHFGFFHRVGSRGNLPVWNVLGADFRVTSAANELPRSRRDMAASHTEPSSERSAWAATMSAVRSRPGAGGDWDATQSV